MSLPVPRVPDGEGDVSIPSGSFNPMPSTSEGVPVPHGLTTGGGLPVVTHAPWAFPRTAVSGGPRQREDDAAAEAASRVLTTQRELGAIVSEAAWPAYAVRPVIADGQDHSIPPYIRVALLLNPTAGALSFTLGSLPFSVAATSAATLPTLQILTYNAASGLVGFFSTDPADAMALTSRV